MIKHNLLLFFRNAKKNKNTFLINLIGLSTALVCVLLIYTWVNHELQIDTFHTKDKQLLQVLENEKTPNGIATYETTPGLLAQSLLEDFPEVQLATSVVPHDWFEGEKFVLSNNDGTYVQSLGQFASKDYFSIFSFPLLYGNASEVLATKEAIAISETLAKKIFQTTEVLGKSIQWIHEDFGGTYTITGVFKDIPNTSTAQFDAVFNYDVFLDDNEDLLGWSDSDPSTYLIVHPGTEIDQFNTKIKGYLKTKNKNSNTALIAQQYSKRYLFGNYKNGVPADGRIIYIRLFSIIAIFILLIACINFMNLSTAQASYRMKEIGIKKALGVFRKKIIIQYLSESIIMVAISLIIALVVAHLFLPQFSAIIGKEIPLELSINAIIALITITVLTGIIAGSYPALYLSSFSPIKALKGFFSSTNENVFTRKGLVIFQFTISSILIVAILIINRQVDHIQSKNLGYDKENTIWFTPGVTLSENADLTTISKERIESFLQSLKNVPGVVDASNFAHNMVGDYGTTTGLDWAGNQKKNSIQFAQVSGGYDFIKTMKINIIEGRAYGRDFKADTSSIIFNEAAIEAMGIEDPIGATISLWGKDRRIVGVMKNFHFDMFYEEIQPLFVKLDVNPFASNFIVRLDKGDQMKTIIQIENAYKKFFGSVLPFEFKYLNENYQKLYAQEIQIAQLSSYFGGLAIVISCLGLLGLVIYTAERRRKEISIRKTLGQNTYQITLLLSSEFVKLVGVAILIGLPISFMLSQNWLSSFAYKIDIKLWHFLSAGLITMGIALITVITQTITASNKNPIEALQQE